MKKLTLMAACMVAAMAISCQNDDVSDPKVPGQSADVAYISLKVETPASRASLDGTPEVGTADENKVSSVALLSFNTSYDYLGYTLVTKATSDRFVCQVSPTARRFFAFVNPSDGLMKELSDANLSSLTQAQFEALPPFELSIASITTNNPNHDKSENLGFTMANCGAKNSGGILLEAVQSITADKLGTTEAEATAVDITVDRLAAKFEYSVGANFTANTEDKFGTVTAPAAKGEVVGVALTARNKAVHPYTVILTDQLTGGNVYRKDHNQNVGEGLTDVAEIRKALTDNFHWLENGEPTTDAAFISTKTDGSGNIVAEGPEYVLENTVASAPGMNTSNNLTQAIVKAKYNPTMSNGSILPLGTSWFKMKTSTGAGTLYLTFDEVKEVYAGTYTPFVPDAAGKASMDVQLNKIMGTTGKTWNDADVTETALDNCDYGGYLAATVPSQSDYVLQYYQNAMNYYNVFIQHDDKGGAGVSGDLGRWGMVRNNSYKLSITGISNEGLPYIPDPTDPDIVDPENLDPKDPEPADKVKAYIGVKIIVNPWILWTQESPLQ